MKYCSLQSGPPTGRGGGILKLFGIPFPMYAPYQFLLNIVTVYGLAECSANLSRLYHAKKFWIKTTVL